MPDVSFKNSFNLWPGGSDKQIYRPNFWRLRGPRRLSSSQVRDYLLAQSATLPGRPSILLTISSGRILYASCGGTSSWNAWLNGAWWLVARGECQDSVETTLSHWLLTFMRQVRAHQNKLSRRRRLAKGALRSAPSVTRREQSQLFPANTASLAVQ